MTNDEVKGWLVRSLDDAAERRERKASKQAYTGKDMDAYVAYLAVRDSVASIADALIRSYVEVRERLDPCRAVEIESEAFRMVGFHSAPASAAVFLERLMAELQREAGADLRSMEPASAARH